MVLSNGKGSQKNPISSSLRKVLRLNLTSEGKTSDNQVDWHFSFANHGDEIDFFNYKERSFKIIVKLKNIFFNEIHKIGPPALPPHKLFWKCHHFKKAFIWNLFCIPCLFCHFWQNWRLKSLTDLWALALKGKGEQKKYKRKKKGRAFCWNEILPFLGHLA